MAIIKRINRPNFSLEKACQVCRVAGLDEAGRGAWAGPVFAAAVMFMTESLPLSILEQIHDSKQVSALRRIQIVEKLKNLDHEVIWCVDCADVEEIDNLNIRQATFLAMQRAVQGLKMQPQMILVDGHEGPLFEIPSQPIIKGDCLSLSIAAASLFAKVYRDQYMKKLSEDYPYFRWENNVGYGTKAHQDGLNIHGTTPHHRKSYAPIQALLLRQ